MRERKGEVFFPDVRLGFSPRLGFGADAMLDTPVSEVEGTHWQMRGAGVALKIYIYISAASLISLINHPSLPLRDFSCPGQTTTHNNHLT